MKQIKRQLEGMDLEGEIPTKLCTYINLREL